MSAENKRKEEENKREKEKNDSQLGSYYDFLDEYTDKTSEHLPDFYLRSKEEGFPDLAIEVKTLRKDHDRPAAYGKPLEVKEHYLSVKDFQFVLKLDLPVHKNPDPIKVKRIWDSLKKELDKYKEKF